MTRLLRWGLASIAVIIALSPPARADAATDVLAQEARWLKAITDGDRQTVEEILAPGFKHVTSEGALLDRGQEIAGLRKESFTMNPSEQIVDLEGDTAVVHGVNTLMQAGTLLARERFTDVFVLTDGGWMALAAQETALI
jgi:hypothetical protein